MRSKSIAKSRSNSVSSVASVCSVVFQEAANPECKDMNRLPRIILVRPRNPNNIGAVARAMNNFGFSELTVVSPHPPVWSEVLTSAVGAEGVVQTARVSASLGEAVSDCSFVIGTIDQRRATGRTPKQLVEEGTWKTLRTAIVFGSEKSGLSNEDLSHCSVVANIPTRPECPSMNLGQAAAVICYEFARADDWAALPTVTDDSEVTASEIDLLLDKLEGTLTMAGFVNESNRERMLIEIRSSVMRVRLTRRELNLWLGALRRIVNSIEKT
jgi:tRNA/rRNA methyltransferase